MGFTLSQAVFIASVSEPRHRKIRLPTYRYRRARKIAKSDYLPASRYVHMKQAGSHFMKYDFFF